MVSDPKNSELHQLSDLPAGRGNQTPPVRLEDEVTRFHDDGWLVCGIHFLCFFGFTDWFYVGLQL